MSPLVPLVRHEAREARVSWITAACVSFVALATVHALFPLDATVADAAAMTTQVLIALWTLYFAADSFASDCASGRMSTKALLPVRALDLWRAKVVFLLIAVGLLAAWTIACEYALQAAFGTSSSLAHFETALLSMTLGAPYLALLAATAVLCSLVVENALVALLLSSIVCAALAGVGVLLSRVSWIFHVDWSATHTSIAILVCAVVLTWLGAHAFARGQRELGSRAVRVRVVLSGAGVLVLVGGIGTASEAYRSVLATLERASTRFQSASASPDGRYLAIEVEGALRGSTSTPRTVWMLDLETRSVELVAWPALLLRDAHTGATLPWDDDRSLHVERFRAHDWRELDAVVRVDANDGGCVVEPDALEILSSSRIVPAWAEVKVVERRADEARGLRVRWIERGIERTFQDAERTVRLGSDVVPSPEPGRVLVLRDGALVLVDLALNDERVLLARGALHLFPSPDGSAVIVFCSSELRALSTIDGASLHAPWDLSGAWVQWIEGEGSSRALRVSEVGLGGRDFVLDVDTRTQFELSSNRSHGLLHRLADGGYVYVDRDDDLVRVDARGERVAVLVDR